MGRQLIALSQDNKYYTLRPSINAVFLITIYGAVRVRSDSTLCD
jgi:hypothetical protein